MATDDPTAPAGTTSTGCACPHGHEVVLVVEDDPTVLDVVARMLSRVGYRVLASARADLALAAAGRGAEVDLLLSDVVLPGMSGVELRDRMTRTRPGLRTLFMTGYGRAYVEDRDPLRPEDEVLEKPFSPVALAQRVRAVLDAR